MLGFFLYCVCIAFCLINSRIPNSHKHKFQFDLHEKTENNIQTKRNSVKKLLFFFLWKTLSSYNPSPPVYGWCSSTHHPPVYVRNYNNLILEMF